MGLGEGESEEGAETIYAEGESVKRSVSVSVS